MGFSNYANTKELDEAKGGLTKKLGSPDVSTPEGLQQYAAEKGITLPAEKPNLLLRGVAGGINALLFLPRQVGKLLQFTKGVKSEDIDGSLMPSDVLFGKTEEPESFFQSIKKQFTTADGLKRLAVDIVFDPLTYITLGTGAAIKVVTQAGKKVAIKKTGQILLKELAEEMVEKGAVRSVAVARAREQVGRLVSTEASDLIARGGLKNIQRALQVMGKKPTAVAIKKIIQEGAEGLVRKPAVRFAGKELFKLPKFSGVFKGVTNSLGKIDSLKPLIRGVEESGQAIGKLFSRDFGLPKKFIPVKQRFIDSFDAAAGRIQANLKVTFAGTSKAERIAISNAIDTGKLYKLSPKLQPLAKRTQQIFKAVAREEEKRGLLDKTIGDYVSHIYKNTSKSKSIIAALRNGQPSGLLKFNKARLIQDLSTAKSLGLEPIEDIAEILNIRLLASERAKLTQDFVKNVSNKFGIQALKKNPQLNLHILNAGESLVKLSDVATGVPKQFKNTFLPQNIADDIAKLGDRFLGTEANKLLKGYDKVHNFWKGSVTVAFPAFHFRNAISNVAQSFLDIGTQALNPARHKEVMEVLMGLDGALVTDLGEEISYKAIRESMKSNQIFQDVLRRTDVGRQLNKNVLRKGNLFDIGRKVGRAIENEARVVNFVTNIRRGMDISDAAARTKQFLFDYDNLSLFEKDVMRRAIPFYTWTRKNIALQLKGLATQPGKAAAQAKMFNTLNEMFALKMTEDEKKFTPDWIAQGLNILAGRKGDDRTFLVGFDLPLEDLFQKTTEFVENPFKAVLNQLSPFIKAPIEIATGKNIFADKDISDDDSGNFAENLPKAFKDWLEFTSKDVATKEGREFTIMKVNSQKKFIFNNVTSILGVGRLSAATTVNGMSAMFSAFKGDKITFQDKADILRLFTAFTFKTTSLEAERKKQEKEESAKLEAELQRKGEEIATFERRFIPKGTGGLEKKL